LHEGTTKILQYLRNRHIYWSNAAREIPELLSQCICVSKKNSTPKPYSELKHIQAHHVLHILAVDLYSYNEKMYFTAICIFSKFAWVHEVANSEAETVKLVYEKFCKLFEEPLLLSCDNGREFALIETVRIDNPSYHPQSNGVIERFHLELGKQSRIHDVSPDLAVQYINEKKSVRMFDEYLQNFRQDVEPVCVLQIATRQFDYNSLAWKFVHSRGRAKHEDTYTGPHRVLKSAGKFSYVVTSHLKNSRKMQVNVNDLKEFLIPCTKNWILNEKYFKEAVNELDVKIQKPKVLINFSGIDSLVQDVLDKKITDVQFFVIPDWPCMSWYGRLHREIKAEAVKLPRRFDLFLDEKQRPLGEFAWEHWLFALDD
jgi:hypothetical protein